MNMLNQTIGECLKRRALETPELPAMAFEDESYSFRELDDISDYLAVRCLKSGINKGVHVGIWGVNSLNWLAFFFALTKIGAVPVLINICCKDMELEYVLKYADVAVLLHGIRCKDLDYYAEIRRLDRGKMPKLRNIVPMEERCIDDLRKDCYACKLSDEEAAQLETAKRNVLPQDTACMLFTSGTTSNPKGVMLTHYNLVNNSAQHTKSMHWQSDDKLCVCVPLFHCFGITAGVLAMLHCGASLQLVKYYSSTQVMQTIEKYRCTILSGVPSMFLALIRNKSFQAYDLSSLRSGIIAGSPLSEEDYITICEKLKLQKLQPAYGQTESSPCIAMADFDDSVAIKSKSCGRPVPNVEVVIWDNARNVPLSKNERGEIRARGYNVMAQYYNLPEETAMVLTGDGWLKTGDEGFIDDDGYLHVTGRLKDIIIRGGENISASEIENCIKKLEEISCVKVIGLPDKVMQEAVAACVICQRDKRIEAEQIIDFVRQRLSPYKIPQYVLFFERFPMTSSGKINSKALIQQAMQMISTVHDK